MSSAEHLPDEQNPLEHPLPSDAGGLKREAQSLRRQLQRAQLRIEALEKGLKGRGGGAALGGLDDEMRLLAEQHERRAMLLDHYEQTARELQQNVQPIMEARPEGIRFAIESRPGVRVGGDFYDIINLSDNFVAFLIADVSGYGLPAAVIMATGRLAFRTYAANQLKPRVIMEKVNQAMLRTTLAGHYMTAFLGVLDTELLNLEYVNASHCSPFLIRDGKVISLDTEGLFVGMFEEPKYEQKGLQMEQHDRIFLYTDGLLKGFQARDQREAESKLGQYLKESGEQDLEELVAQLGALVQNPEDDIALLGVELLLEKARRKTISISSIPSELAHVESAILPVLDNKGYGERNIFAVKLALEEAVVNAIKHGNQLDDTKKVTISFYIDDDRALISIEDEGEGFDPSAIADPTDPENLMASSGRGLALIRAYMDEVRFNEKGNEISLVKYAPWAVAHRI